LLQKLDGDKHDERNSISSAASIVMDPFVATHALGGVSVLMAAPVTQATASKKPMALDSESSPLATTLDLGDSAALIIFIDDNDFLKTQPPSEYLKLSMLDKTTGS